MGKYFHNKRQLLDVDNINLPIIVIPINQWPEGKTDKTEYSTNEKIVRVRDDYDYKSDPIGNMRHELMHYLQDIDGVVDDGKDYPKNNIERVAYIHQFNYLKSIGYTNLNKVLNLIGKERHRTILKTYWDE